MPARTPNLRISLGILSSLMLSTVSILGGCSKLGQTSPTSPTDPPSPGTTLVYSAVGASDASGIGSSVECVPFTDCPAGMGYVQTAARQLQGQGFTVSLLNLGIPTAVIGRDFQTLGASSGKFIAGNFIDDEMPFVQKNATLVTIFAGANDVNAITAALGTGAGGSNPQGYIDQQVRAFGSDYATLVGGVRGRAGSPRIIALNLPNMAALPFMAAASLDQRQAAQRASVSFTTTVINPLTAQGVIVIDLMCDARLYQPSIYSADGFHPNDAGYAILAAEVVRATISSYPAPSSSCAQMTVVPDP